MNLLKRGKPGSALSHRSDRSGKRRSSGAWLVLALAAVFCLAVFFTTVVDGALSLAGHALAQIGFSSSSNSAPVAQQVQPLRSWLSWLGAVFLFGLIWGTSLVLDDDAHELSGTRSPAARTLICAALGTGVVALLCWGTPGGFPLPWIAVGTTAGGVLGALGKVWAEQI